MITIHVKGQSRVEEKEMSEQIVRAVEATTSGYWRGKRRSSSVDTADQNTIITIEVG